MIPGTYSDPSNVEHTQKGTAHRLSFPLCRAWRIGQGSASGRVDCFSRCRHTPVTSMPSICGACNRGDGHQLFHVRARGRATSSGFRAEVPRRSVLSCMMYILYVLFMARSGYCMGRKAGPEDAASRETGWVTLSAEAQHVCKLIVKLASSRTDRPTLWHLSYRVILVPTRSRNEEGRPSLL